MKALLSLLYKFFLSFRRLRYSLVWDTSKVYKNPILRYPNNRICYCGSSKIFYACHKPILPKTVDKSTAIEADKAMRAKGY